MSVKGISAKDLLEKRVREAQEWLPKQVLKDCRILTPIDTGRMVNTPVIEQEGTRIRYTVPYAAIMYGGYMRTPPYRHFHYQSPTAVDHWFQEAKKVHGQEWLDGIRKIITKKGK